MKKHILYAAFALSISGMLRAEDPNDAVWKQQMEHKVDALTQELERRRFSAPAEAGANLTNPIPLSPYSFGPGAAKVYGVDQGLSIAGYGEMIYQGFAHRKADSLVNDEARVAQIDLTRLVLYTGYRFTDKILFDSELEVEASNSSKSGEVGAEFAFLDFALSKPAGIRVGKVLLPMGLTNEYHEPPAFHGALRPDVEQFIIPTTWAENGAGFYGELGPIAYRGYVVAGLRAARDSGMNQDGAQPDMGLRESRQEGSKSRAQNLAFVQRIDYVGLPGFVVGASVFTGNAGQGDTTPAGVKIDAPVTLWDAHARAEYRGFDLRALYTQATVGGAGEINAANGLVGNQSVGQYLWGGYVELGYNILNLLAPASRQSVSPFARYERYNTQGTVPSGFTSDPANDRTVYTLGLDYKPIPRVVLKADYQIRDNHAGTGVNQFNLGAGYEF